MCKKLSFLLIFIQLILFNVNTNASAVEDPTFCVPEAPCTMRFQFLQQTTSNIDEILTQLVTRLNKESFFQVWGELQVNQDQDVEFIFSPPALANQEEEKEVVMREPSIAILYKRLTDLPAMQSLLSSTVDADTLKSTVVFLVLDSIIRKDLKEISSSNTDFSPYQEALHYTTCYLAYLRGIAFDYNPDHLYIIISKNPSSDTASFTQGAFQFDFAAEVMDDEILIQDPETGHIFRITPEENQSYWDLQKSGKEFLNSLFPSYLGISTQLPESFIVEGFKTKDIQYEYDHYSNRFLGGRREKKADGPIQLDTNSSTELQLLQERVNSLSWNININVMPPVPKNENPIDSTAAEEWISAHTDPDQRDVAEEMVRQLQYISFDTFSSDLVESVNLFNNYLSTLPLEDQNYIVLILDPEKNKSDRWITSLALPFLDTWPNEIISDKEYIIDFLKKHPHLQHIVIFDDASYSGSQVGKRVSALNASLALLNQSRELQNLDPRKLNVHLVIPYLKHYGMLRAWFPNDPNLTVHEYAVKEFGSLGEKLSEEERSLVNAMWPHEPCMVQMAWIVFQHKVADQKSLPWNILDEGQVGLTRFDQASKQISKIKASILEKGYFSPMLLRSLENPTKTGPFVDTSLIPPYKRRPIHSQ